MRTILSIMLFFAGVVFFGSCKNHKNAVTHSATAISDSASIKNLILQKQSRRYSLLSDTVRMPTKGNTPALYFSYTNYYYDNSTKELFKVENVLQAVGKTMFEAYYDNGNVLKTVANTEWGTYSYYRSINDSIELSGNKADTSKQGYKNMFRLQSLQLAKEQLTNFGDKIKSRMN